MTEATRAAAAYGDTLSVPMRPSPSSAVHSVRLSFLVQNARGSICGFGMRFLSSSIGQIKTCFTNGGVKFRSPAKMVVAAASPPFADSKDCNTCWVYVDGSGIR